MELRDALRSIHLLDEDPYLTMQATNVSLVEYLIMGLEGDVLQKLWQEERTPGPEAAFLSAQTQMWFFAVYELLRTVRSRSRDFIIWAANGGLLTMIAGLEKDLGYLHPGRELRADQLRELLARPELVDRLRDDLRVSHIPFRRLEHLRISLAKHEIAKKRNSIALAPGYGRINQWCGSLQYQIEKGAVIIDFVCRRDIADELRAMADREEIQTDAEIAMFDAVMDQEPGDVASLFEEPGTDGEP
ncbi:MAG: hypothetical protein ACAH22_02285 [Tardiphaga sp.]